MNNSTSFLLWLLGPKAYTILPNLNEVYIGDVEYEGEDSWGNYLYLLMAKDTPDHIIELLRTHEQYKTEYDPEEGLMFVFNLTEKQKTTIVRPFIEGKYSRIDRDYVNTYFRQYLSNGRMSNNWKILYKHEDLRRDWEEVLDVTFTDDMEVWSKPRKEQEIRGYIGAELENIVSL